jgi:hypothetical protein
MSHITTAPRHSGHGSTLLTTTASLAACDELLEREQLSVRELRPRAPLRRAPACDDLAVEHDDGPDRQLVVAAGRLGFVKGFVHEALRLRSKARGQRFG